MATGVLTGGSVSWAAVTDKPTTFPPTIGTTSTTAVAGNDSRLTNSRTPSAHTSAGGGAGICGELHNFNINSIEVRPLA